MKSVLSQEFISTERKQVILEAIDGLIDISRTRRLNPVEHAALKALQSLHSLCVARKGALTAAAMARPIAIAQRAIERAAILSR